VITRDKIVIGAFVSVTIALASVFYVTCSRFMAIDRCLDHGGRWDYDNELCDQGDNGTTQNDGE
jgi:hypothetical protein